MTSIDFVRTKRGLETKENWTCSLCALDNLHSSDKCIACGTSRPIDQADWMCGRCVQALTVNQTVCPSCGFTGAVQEEFESPEIVWTASKLQTATLEQLSGIGKDIATKICARLRIKNSIQALLQLSAAERGRRQINMTFNIFLSPKFRDQTDADITKARLAYVKFGLATDELCAYVVQEQKEADAILRSQDTGNGWRIWGSPLSEIFSYLNIESIARIMSTCRGWKIAAQNNILWQPFIGEFPSLQQLLQENATPQILASRKADHTYWYRWYSKLRGMGNMTSVRISFGAPSNSPTFLCDTGKQFASPGPYRFGWSESLTNLSLSRNRLSDHGKGAFRRRGMKNLAALESTLMHFPTNKHANWSLEVPANCTYRVWLLVGDPMYPSKAYITVNGVVVFDEQKNNIAGTRSRAIRVRVTSPTATGRITVASQYVTDKNECTRIGAITIMDERLVKVDPDILKDLAIVESQHFSSTERNLLAKRRKIALRIQRLEKKLGVAMVHNQHSPDMLVALEIEALREQLDELAESMNQTSAELEKESKSKEKQSEALPNSNSNKRAFVKCKPSLFKEGPRIRVVDMC